MTRARIAVLAAVGLVLIASPWWGRRVLRTLAYFHVREVRVVGARYLEPREVVAAMRVDTNASTWDDLKPYSARVSTLTLVQRAEIERELPGTLVVRVTETAPVALASVAGGLRVYDARARVLPIDPAKADVDLPITDRPDVVVMRLLAGLEAISPRMFARISSVSRLGEQIIVQMDRGIVRAGVDITPERLAGAGLVAADLDRRGQYYTELDLRYRDQVVARLR